MSGDGNAFDALLEENRRFPPPSTFADGAVVSDESIYAEAVSDRLARSRLVSARTGGELPLREAALISAVICHPDLINEAFDDFVAMEFEHAGLEAMRGAVLEAHAASGARTREDLLAAPALVAHGSNSADARSRRADGGARTLRATSAGLRRRNREAEDHISAPGRVQG